MHHDVVGASIQFYAFLNENFSNLPPPTHIHASQQISNEAIDINHLFIYNFVQKPLPCRKLLQYILNCILREACFIWNALRDNLWLSIYISYHFLFVCTPCTLWQTYAGGMDTAASFSLSVPLKNTSAGFLPTFILTLVLTQFSLVFPLKKHSQLH
jgi:hypothetical protein